MKTTKSRTAGALKVRTGIEGFDELTHGGLPQGRTTLLEGGSGSGKTLFALRFLVHGAQNSEPGIFVAFEETSPRIIANAEGFGWGLGGLQRRRLFFLDALPSTDFIHAGSFDLGGMLAALGAQANAMGTRRIVFDAIDIVLARLPDEATKRREVYRLHEWLAEVAGELKRVSLDAEEAVLVVRAKSLQTELLAKKVEKTLLTRTTESKKGELSRGRIRMRELRGGDVAAPSPKARVL